MVNDKKATSNSFKRWVTQTAREQECYEDEVVDVIHEYIVDSIAEGNLC